MEAKELRIGNLVKCNPKFSKEVSTFVEYDDEIVKIKHISEKETEWWSMGCHITQLIPIPLTEEWLLKFGFELNDDAYLKTEGRQSISIPRFNKDDDFYILYQEDVGCGYNPLRYLDYVHELQNLYFALTGKELTLKE